MNTFADMYAALRRKNWGNYALLIGCCLFSVMLITAFITMMCAPTVLEILPEGGDSRKQIMMVFAVAVIGCGMFTMYASSLFFRYKSREIGIFMALGATKRELRNLLLREIALIACGSCIVGAALSAPLSFGLWGLFRLLIDTEEMVLRLDPRAYFIAALFSAFVIIMLFVMAVRFVCRTDILDIAREQHKSEPVREIPPWCGAVGIVLMIVGGFCGYILPTVFVRILHRAPVSWGNLVYLLALVGLYMVLLHTVVCGWARGKNRYKHLITHSMMKFQGRQTVRNMLVVTLLLAGAFFAAFYTPMLGTARVMIVKSRPVDYAYHFRQDQSMLTQQEVEQLAGKYAVSITDWKEAEFASLGSDGNEQIYQNDGTITTAYHALWSENSFLPESAYRQMTGQKIDVAPGTVKAVISADGTGTEMISTDVTRLTNPITGQTLATKYAGYLHFDMMSAKFYVLDDADYLHITQGLTAQWREKLVYFNVANAMSTYDFSKALYNAFIAHLDISCAQGEFYDRIQKQLATDAGERYWYDQTSSDFTFDRRESSQFKMYWRYMPQFRVMDLNDFTGTMAVFLMVFVFIAIVCFAAVVVILYTRSMTIALNNQTIYNDLRHLGAKRCYLYRTVREQISKIFFVPAITGTTLIYAFYAMILYFNDNQITATERAGLVSCLLLVAACSICLWGIYRITLRRVCRTLGI